MHGRTLIALVTSALVVPVAAQPPTGGDLAFDDSDRFLAGSVRFNGSRIRSRVPSGLLAGFRCGFPMRQLRAREPGP